MHSPRPAFSQNNIPVIFCTDGRFLPYTAVALSSLAAAARDGYNYDLLIVSGDKILSEARQCLQASLGKKENISIRFICIPESLKILTDKLSVREGYSPVIYYRLFIPQLFKHYTKVIFCDADVLFLRGIEELYNQSLPQNLLLAAVPDSLPYSGTEQAQKNFAAYTRRLGLKTPFSYINSGVLLWNLAQTRSQKLDKQLWQKLPLLPKPSLFPDQDVLNLVFQGKIFYLTAAYNFFAQEPDIRPPFDAEAETYLRARREAAQNPAVIHYAGFAKPWFYPHMPYATAWWQAAAQTPFYDEILARLHAHDRRMQRHWANAALAAKLYFYKIMNKLSGGRCEDKILHVSDRLDMNNYWRKNRFKKQEEDL